jgi:glucosamine kinase
MSPVLIGADVGGSKTAVAVSDGTTIRGRALGPGAAVRPGRAIASAATIAETVRKAQSASGLGRGNVLVVGAAGAGRESERRELEQALRVETLADRVHVTTDIEVALTAAFGDGPGIVVVAGTGSVVMGRDPEGRMLRQGGYGWQMGDEGSGYAIGRAALGAASRARDGRSPETALTPVLRGARGGGDARAARAAHRGAGGRRGAGDRRLRRARAEHARPGAGEGVSDG